jgi:hypothetical protein
MLGMGVELSIAWWELVILVYNLRARRTPADPASLRRGAHLLDRFHFPAFP